MLLPRISRAWHRVGSNPAGRRPASRRAAFQVQLLEDRLTPTIIFGNPGIRIPETGLTGPVLQNAHIELVFWGSGWTSSEIAATGSDIDSMLSGPYLGSL